MAMEIILATIAHLIIQDTSASNSCSFYWPPNADRSPSAWYWRQLRLIARRQMPPMEKLLDKYPEAQTNDNGEVAVKYRQPGRVLLQGNPSGKEYVAITQANICMAWIDPADVGHVLAKKDGCCGGKRQSFYLANEADVRRWTNKGGQ
jgi:hypothetical protein